MGTRITGNGAEKVYAAAEAWVERALRADDSLFTPGWRIWSKQWLEEARWRFLDQPDESNARFLEKFKVQLAGSPSEVYQLMGEVLYFHFLFASTTDSASKQQTIESVLGWSTSPVEVPPQLIAGLTPGIASPGTYFNTGRPYHVGFLIEFAERWKELSPGVRSRLLDNPRDFKTFATGLEFRSALLRGFPNRPRVQREAMLHLLFPDTFEPIVSVDHKARIAVGFAEYVNSSESDVDRKLEQIRARLEAKYESSDGLFYKPEIRSRWDDSYNLDDWGKFVEGARAYYDTGKLESEEIEYKLRLSNRLGEARLAVTTGDNDWARLVKRGIDNSLNNLIRWSRRSTFGQWIDASPDDSLNALRKLWTEEAASATERVRAFCDLLPRAASSGTGVRTTLASVLLMGLDASEYPPYQVGVFKQAYQQTLFGQPEQDADEAAVYQHALDFLDRFIAEASERGLELHNRLEAQSLVWAIRPNSEGGPESGEESGVESEEEDPSQVMDPWATPSLEALAKELRWETGFLEKIVDGLKDKGQVIFQGPPGTGKTFVAKQIAQWSKDHGGDFQIVQFHPSYSYEDLVEGFRPTLINGSQPGFELNRGPLRRIADQAKDNPAATFILLIDEINRGNVAKILGELYFLLEYRDEEIQLLYSSEPFSLPRNLWIIGTMNTTDRSIALVDAALRRRFYFFGFFPDEAPVQGLLRRWLESNSPQMGWVADLVDLANRKLQDRHLGIGPSHFMKTDPPLQEKRVRFIWEQAVIPYIEEQCFGDEDKLAQFGYDRLMSELNGTAPGPLGDHADGPADEDQGEAGATSGDV